MDIEKQLYECTTSFDDFLLELLTDPEAAKYYLEASLEEYKKDKNVEILLQCMRNVIEAQGGITKFARRTKSNPTRLHGIFNGKQPVQMNNLLDILEGLGFHSRNSLE